jgi:hypothetical protein
VEIGSPKSTNHVEGEDYPQKEGLDPLYRSERIHAPEKGFGFTTERDEIQKQKLEGFNYERVRIHEKNSRFRQGEK